MKQKWIYITDANDIAHAKPANNFLRMKANEILKTMGFDNNKYILKIKTPLYSKEISPKARVLKRYPNLLLTNKPDQYDHPAFSLSIEPITKKRIVSLFVDVKTTNQIEIPSFCVDINLTENKSGQELLQKMDESFQLPHTDGFCSSINPTDSIQSIYKHSKKNKLTFKCTLTTESLHIIAQRQNIINEIIKTESNYVSNLSVILNYWQPKIKNSKIFTDIDINKIFKGIPAIYKCHFLFLENLRNQIISYSTIVSDAFLEFSDYFKVSLPYISNYPNMIQLLTPKMNNRTLLFLDKDGNQFSSFLILPVQRMPQYLLFLRQLIKYTPSSHPDSSRLKLALNKIEKVTFEMDKASKNAQKINDVLILQQKLTKHIQLVEASRYIKRIINVKYKNRNYKFYLFNDLITINQFDKKTETILYYQKIINFKYFPSFNSLSFFDKNKLRKIQFESSSDYSLIITQIEQIRKELYQRINEIDIDNMFIWSNPTLLKKLPLAIESRSLTYENIFYYFTNCNLIILDPYKLSLNLIHLKQQRFGYSLCNNKNLFYLIGGVNNHKEYFNDIIEFNCNTKQFIKINTINSEIFEPRCEHTSIIYSNKIYIFGGRNKEKYFNTIICFSLLENKFYEIDVKNQTLPNQRSLHSAILKQNYMLIYGGRNHRIVFNDIWLFDLMNYKWNQITSNNIPKRFGHNTININDYIINIGGTNDGINGIPILIYKLNGYNIEKVQQYESFGNFPNLIINFGICSDIENKLIMFHVSSFFIITLPKIIINEIESIKINNKKRSETIKDIKAHYFKDNNNMFSKDTTSTLHMYRTTRQNSTINNFNMIRGEENVKNDDDEDDEENSFQSSSETFSSEQSNNSSKDFRRKKSLDMIPIKEDIYKKKQRKYTLQPLKRENGVKKRNMKHNMRNASRLNFSEEELQNEADREKDKSILES